MAVRMPGAWTVAAAAAFAGGLVGATGSALKATLIPWQVGDLVPGTGPVAADAPRVEVAETTYAFGTVGTGETGSHRFEVRNAGGGPLTLRKGSSSCSCTVSDFDAESTEGEEPRRVVPPGESSLVTVQWKGKPPGGPFRQQVTVLTDDPRRPEIVFVVEGTVLPSWKAVPSVIALPRLTASASEQAATTIFTFGEEAPVVESLAIDHPQAAQFFSLASAPLSSAEVAAEPGATGGFRIEVTVHPGLPLGLLKQTLSARFRMPQPVTAELLFEGSVGGDLVLAGQGWDSSRQALRLGTVSGRTGLKTRLFLTAKGPHRDAVRPTVVETVPETLEVTVGEAKPIGSGGVVRIPLEIVIPPGSRPVNHICSEQAPAGRIVLATGHPDTPTLSIPVCVVIGP
ncbi:MAG: hypothetical protein RLZZ440_848 [Planctomycetota bacterium]